MTEPAADGIPRSLAHVRQAFDLAARDLALTGRGSWTCAVDDAFVLRVNHAARTESVQLSPTADPAGLPPDDEWLRPPLLDVTLADDAFELAVGELLEVADLWGEPWVTCPSDHAPLTWCSGEWLCDHEGCAFSCAVGELAEGYEHA